MLPAPEPGDILDAPPAAPTGAEPGGGDVQDGATVCTDPSATRPKDSPLKRAACAIWVGGGRSNLIVAWPHRGVIQRDYKAELYAFVASVEYVQSRTGLLGRRRGGVEATGLGQAFAHVQACGFVGAPQ